MDAFLRGFAGELVKTGGALKSLGKLVAKHPMVALSAGATALGTAAAAGSAYKQGLRGGEKARYLPAGINRYTGAAEPSEASFINYNQLFSRKPDRRQVAALSKNYRESAFRR